MKKKAKKELSIKKISISKISNLDYVRGGIVPSGLGDICDLTTRGPETVDAVQCASHDCGDIFI